MSALSGKPEAESLAPTWTPWFKNEGHVGTGGGCRSPSVPSRPDKKTSALWLATQDRHSGRECRNLPKLGRADPQDLSRPTLSTGIPLRPAVFPLARNAKDKGRLNSSRCHPWTTRPCWLFTRNQP